MEKEKISRFSPKNKKSLLWLENKAAERKLLGHRLKTHGVNMADLLIYLYQKTAKD